MTLHMYTWPAVFLTLGFYSASCQKKITNEEVLSAETKTITANAFKSTWTTNWNNYGDGVYSNASAASDFGNVSG
jgi:hypothetical protein